MTRTATTPEERLQVALDFLREADKLKSVLRRTRLTFAPDRRENDAEHSWHLALMAVVLREESLEPGLDLARVLTMILVHDLVEIDAGDTFFYDQQGLATQEERELRAAERIFGLLDEARGGQLRAAWDEFEARRSPEARFARALDRAQPILQNLYTAGRSWQEHGVTARDVRERNGPTVRDGAPRLWSRIDALLAEAVARGDLAAGS